jgi:all-beta uncharacterized protein
MRYLGLLVVLLLAVDARTASAQCASPMVSPTTVSVPSTGSPPSTLSVTTGTSCPWSVSSSVTWITITGATGSGIGWVNYTVAANSTSFPRTGMITVSGLNGSTTVTVNQAANSCVYTVTPTSFTVPTSALSVSSGTSCAWTAVSNVGWITITGGASGSGIGGVNFVVAANTGAERSGTLTVAGKTVTFTQGGTPPLAAPTNLRIIK